MKDIINWLILIEKETKDLYNEASDHFKHDNMFSNFLSRLSNDEHVHCRLMEQAASFIAGGNVPAPPEIIFDESLRRGTEDLIAGLRARLSSGSMGKKDFMDAVITIEYAERNQIFMYAVDALKVMSADFQRMASIMEDHIGRIEKFISEDGDILLAEKMEKIKPVWSNTILIVDDTEPVRNLLHGVASSMGNVDTAANGSEGLDKILAGYYNLIVSDVDMPVMDGISMYRKAAEKDDGIGERIIFFTGETSGETISFFRERGLPYLNKPASILAIIEAMKKVLKRYEQ